MTFMYEICTSPMKRIYPLFLVFVLAHSLGLSAQDPTSFQEKFQVNIQKAVSAIKVDGILDEIAWKQVEAAKDFHMKWPTDIGRPTRPTTVKISYDENFIYFGIIAQDTNYYIAQTLKRDNGLYESDAVSIAIDPINRKTNGFIFSITPYNVQSEDLVNAGQDDMEMNFSWDNKWYSATSRHADHWIAEIAIPLKTLRFEPGKKVWGFNVLRSDLKSNEYSSWTDMPLNFNFFDFGYAGSIRWDQGPSSPGGNISFIPYVTGSLQGDSTNVLARGNTGFDAKISLTSSLNLDLTYNPDFSQIEVDRQVTNLTRFDIFFPERRTFFLENNDLFSSFGIPPVRPFYSRTIGLDKYGNKIPIVGGVRLSGNIAPKTRVGLLNMQTGSNNEVSSQNYSAITFNQQVQTRSIVKGYFLNRQSTQPSKVSDPLDAFGRNAGLEYNFVDKTSKWNAWIGHHRSFKPGIESKEFYMNGGGGYLSKKLNFIVDRGRITENYHADMGFINRIVNYDALLDSSIRRGFDQLYNETSYTFFPKKGKLNQLMLRIENFITSNLNHIGYERMHDFEVRMFFKNTSNMIFHVHQNVNNLPFYTSFTESDPVPPGKYVAPSFGYTYNTDSRKKLYFKTDVEIGKFLNGKIFRYEFAATYRLQPLGNFVMSIQNARLEFPHPYGKNNLLLIAPRVEINFSNNIFWTTFFQYNSQRNNFNINSRLQWRFKPMSDFFLVYTDNYFTDPFMKNKNRAIVFKLNYWLNL